MVKTKMNLSPEDRLLRNCAKIEISDTTRSRLKDILDNGLNWPYILQESIKEGIPCLLYNNLSEFKNSVPENILGCLSDIYYKNTYRNVKIYELLKFILSSFAKENLATIPLKGIFLAEKVYGNIALRTMADVDLLIKKEDLPRVDKLLESLNYRTPIHKDVFYPAIEKSYLNSAIYFKTNKGRETKDTIPLHIHWHVVNMILPTYLYAKNIKMVSLWEYAAPTKLGGADTLGLAPHHLVIYLAQHALKHSFEHLVLFSDMDAVIKRYANQIDWDNFIKDTIEWGTEKQVFYSLYFTNYYLETKLPDYLLSKLKPKKINFFEKKFFSFVSNNNRDTELCYFVHLSMVKGLVKKLEFIFRLFFPPPCVLAIYSNINKPKITRKDYLLFLKKRSLRLKEYLRFIKR